jgi:hypothetical protein
LAEYRCSISPVTIVHARNDPRWELRIGAGLVETMHAQLKKARPSETGGLLIGHMNTQRKVVYVIRLLRAPRDSKGTPAVFRRGVFELPEQIRAVEDKTGRLLGPADRRVGPLTMRTKAERSWSARPLYSTTHAISLSPWRHAIIPGRLLAIYDYALQILSRRW